MVPVINISGFIWGPEVLVVPEYCFGVKIGKKEQISLSMEHLECGWFSYEAALNMLKWDSNKTALWELDHRLNNTF